MKKKVIIGCSILLGVIVLFLIAILSFQGYQYSHRQFRSGLAKTTINHINVSGMTTDEAYNVLSDAGNYESLTLKDSDQSYQLDILSFTTYQYEKADIEKAFDQSGSFWHYLFSFSDDLSLPRKVSIDETAATQKFAELFEKEDRTPTSDAYIEQAGQDYILHDEVYGTTIDYAKLLEQLQDALEYGKSSIDLTACYHTPTVVKDNLNADYEKLQKYLSWSVSYTLYDGSSFTIDRSSFQDYVHYSPEDGVTVDYSFLTSVLKQLKSQGSTVGNVRNFTNFYGQAIQVSGGTYGYNINTDKEKEALITLMDSFESQTNRTPIYSHQEVTTEGNGIGNSYIEISLENQHLWYYVDHVLIMETDVVTGMKNKHDTPVGVYYISEKVNGKWLTGDDYRTWVNKWMRLTNKGVGLHDATWKHQFGSNIYETHGSHGCVNLPYDFACALYDAVGVGLPVIIY